MTLLWNKSAHLHSKGLFNITSYQQVWTPRCLSTQCTQTKRRAQSTSPLEHIWRLTRRPGNWNVHDLPFPRVWLQTETFWEERERERWKSQDALPPAPPRTDKRNVSLCLREKKRNEPKSCYEWRETIPHPPSPTPKHSLLISAVAGSFKEGDKLKLFHISLRLSLCIFSLIL